MAKTTVAQSPATATRRAPKLVFRAANARRPFRRGDLALHAGSIVVICMSEHDNGDLDAELPVRTTRGVVGSASARGLRLLAGVDTQEFGPGYHDLLKFISDAATAR
ncbi:hypothetical protein H6CHR_02134 [Variovorax sp. PBL-H6]|uniref:hypothetical protein n=1 Tax=Variovorax sp. PBL-H6 TaxID=434009 RepID=UPI001316C16C|nr:hypothetical protein [Variovorax sp. PBL-H6]VTU24149.1 hypothetical protein H6CHR_02134 [Variovorax sp. PBL-H6]